jgi:Cu2+-exporting ATPase
MSEQEVSSRAAWDDADELARFTRRIVGAGGEPRAESALCIEGMDCAACSLDIERVLMALPGVEAANVNAVTGRAVVRWDPARTVASRIAQAVADAGYRAFPALSMQAEAARARQRRQMLWRLFVAGFCMMQVMMYATPAYVAEPGSMGADIERLLQWASWLLSVPVVMFSAGPFFRGAWADLKRRRAGMDVPVALGIAVTFVASTAVTFEPGGVFGSEVYFDSLTMFVFFLLGGRYLEMRSRDATAAALESLVNALPETAERLSDEGGSEAVPVRRLRVGDRVRVRPGQAFPADGRLLEGAAQVDEALLTGESRPVLRAAGDDVVAGSFNLSAPVVVLVQRAAQDTRQAQIVSLMQRAATERPEATRLADRIAGPFLWAVLLVAGLSALAWSFVEPGRAVWVAVSVLIVTCPCALSLATPAALLAAGGALARRGVLVRQFSALESLARVELFVFDKTGTLTEDRLEVAAVERLGEMSEADLLRHAGALASASLHPVARALAAAAAPGDTVVMQKVEERAGRGLCGLDAQGCTWRLGAPAFACPGTHPVPADRTTAWLSVDGRPRGVFSFDETLRADAREALAQLRAEGVRVALLSGDQPAAARRVAHALGIADVTGGATPEDKLAFVQAAQARGMAVAMVGDGVNDGPVAARADVSFAIGQGAPQLCAQADFTSLGAHLADVAAARRLARRTVSVVRQNLAWAAAYNAVCVPLAMLGWLPPWAAGLGMAASSLLVVLNAGRLRSDARPPHGARARSGATWPQPSPGTH